MVRGFFPWAGEVLGWLVCRGIGVDDAWIGGYSGVLGWELAVDVGRDLEKWYGT